MDSISFSDLLTHSQSYEIKVLEILRELVKFPTVAFRDDDGIKECANYLLELFQKFGYKAVLYPTVPEGSPVVYAEKIVGASKTLLYYNHYDVQPEDPIDAWKSSPWDCTEKDGRMYGRGTIDNKGPFTVNLVAMELLEAQLGELPINVKFVIEGEEEAGSNNLPHFTRPNANLLKADGCIWEGAGLFSMEGDSLVVKNLVEIWCGLKGDAYFDVKAGGIPNYPNRDVHSGLAPAVPNAAWSLIWALNTLKDDKENILVEGFNELVQSPEKAEIEALKEYQGDLESLLKRDYQLDMLLLDRSGLDLYSSVYLGPSFSICGLKSGFQEPGSKTIVPAEASAKLDFRLVPNLTVEKTEELLKAHLRAHGFGDLEVSLVTGYEPAKTSVTHPFIQLIKNATQQIVTPTPVNVIPYAPGSGPAYLFSEHTPLCIVSNRLEGVNGHAPNENIPLNVIKPGLAYNSLIAQHLAYA
jgi:acetylornithine deacetylase/succinyl-diaminopimelate desuccinylase-like protein